MLQHIGYKLFFALCDLFLYPFVPLYYIGITGNMVLLLYWSIHCYMLIGIPICIGNALIGILLVIMWYTLIGTMLPIH